MKNTYIFLFSLILFIACKPGNSPEQSQDSYKHIDQHDSKDLKQITHLPIDTILMQHDIITSGDGFWKIHENAFFFFDRTLATVLIFDQEGTFQKKALGIGRGPAEVLEEIGTVCRSNEGWLLAEVIYMHRFSDDFDNKKTNFFISWNENVASKRETIMESDNPTKYPEVYLPAYDFPQMMQIEDQKALIKISCEYPDFYEPLYYKSALVGEYCFEKGTLTKLMGRYPPCYQNEEFAPAFDNHYFSPYKNGQYLLSFALDPQIYICDQELNPKKAFGKEANFQNTNYILTNAKDNASIDYNINVLLRERKIRGYNTSVFYCPEEDLIFRVYKTGLESKEIPEDLYGINNPSRMQIYKGLDVIGDVAVPHNFEILAYKAPYFYADGLLEVGDEKDKIGVYRFELELK